MQTILALVLSVLVQAAPDQSFAQSADEIKQADDQAAQNLKDVNEAKAKSDAANQAERERIAALPVKVKSNVDKAVEQFCDAFNRVAENQKKLDDQKEYGKVSGMVDKDVMYRAGRGVVEGQKQAKAAIENYGTLTGRKVTAKNADIVVKEIASKCE